MHKNYTAARRPKKKPNFFFFGFTVKILCQAKTRILIIVTTELIVEGKINLLDSCTTFLPFSYFFFFLR